MHLAAGGAFAAVLGLAPGVRAADLQWDAPANCQRADAVSEQVEALIRSPLSAVESLSFAATLRQNGEKWTLELVTRPGGAAAPRRRILTGQSCGEVSDAAALVIAMAVQDAAHEKTDDAEPRGAPSSPAKTTSSTPAMTPAAPASPPPPPLADGVPRLGSLFALGAFADTAALPGSSLGLALNAGVHYRIVRATLEMSALAPRSRELGGGQRAEFSLFSGALIACVEHRLTSVIALGCGGFELGRLSGEGHGITNPRLGSALWEAARVDVGAAFPAGGALRFSSRLGVAVPLERPVFQLDRKDVHRPAALGLRWWLGLELSP